MLIILLYGNHAVGRNYNSTHDTKCSSFYFLAFPASNLEHTSVNYILQEPSDRVIVAVPFGQYSFPVSSSA